MRGNTATAAAPTRRGKRNQPAQPVAIEQDVGQQATGLLGLGMMDQWNRKLFLTLAEAVEYTGLSKTYLSRLIEQQHVLAINDGGYKLSRLDLERWNQTFIQQGAQQMPSSTARKSVGRAQTVSG